MALQTPQATKHQKGQHPAQMTGSARKVTESTPASDPSRLCGTQGQAGVEDWVGWRETAIRTKLTAVGLEPKLINRLLNENWDTGRALSQLSEDDMTDLGFKDSDRRTFAVFCQQYKIPTPTAAVDRLGSQIEGTTNPLIQSPHPLETAHAVPERAERKGPRPADIARPGATLVSAPSSKPQIVRLAMRLDAEDATKKLRSIMIGRATPERKPVKKIALVGASGSGKTTLLNGLANYLYGIDRTDDFRFVVAAESAGANAQAKRKSDQAFSQTQHVTAYKFEWQPGFPCDFSLVVIDSPGFCDTEGLERDAEIEDQLSTFFELGGHSGFDKLDAVVFVVPASRSRLTATQRYVWAKIQKVFGPNLSQNLIVATTFADAGNAQVIAAINAHGIEFAKSLKFNNSELFTAHVAGGSEPNLSTMQWNLATENYRQLISTIEELPTHTVVPNRLSLEAKQHCALLQGIHTDIARSIVQLERLRQQADFVTVHRAELERGVNFCIPVTVFQLVIQAAEGVRYCPICNVVFASAEVNARCRIRRHHSFELEVPFTLQYEEIRECWTLGQLLSASGYDPKTQMTVTQALGELFRTKDAEVHREFAAQLKKGNEILGGLVQEDYVSVLAEVEERNQAPGHAERLRWLNTHRKPTVADGRQTKAGK